MTKKSKFTLEGSDYLIQNDSIIGRGKSEMLGRKSIAKKLNVDLDCKIALADIIKAEANRFDLVGTLAVTIGISVTLYFLISKSMDSRKLLSGLKA